MAMFLVLILMLLRHGSAASSDIDGKMPTTDLFNSIKLLVNYFSVNKQARTPDAMLGVRFASGE